MKTPLSTTTAGGAGPQAAGLLVSHQCRVKEFRRLRWLLKNTHRRQKKPAKKPSNNQSGNSRRCWSSGRTSKKLLVLKKRVLSFARKREKNGVFLVFGFFLGAFFGCFFALGGCFCAFGVFLFFARQRDFCFFGIFFPKAYHTETGDFRSAAHALNL